VCNISFILFLVYLKAADKVPVHLTSIKALKTDLTLYIPETTKQFVIDKLRVSSSQCCGSRYRIQIQVRIRIRIQGLDYQKLKHNP
jgi:hypothetical protein